MMRIALGARWFVDPDVFTQKMNVGIDTVDQLVALIDLLNSPCL